MKFLSLFILLFFSWTILAQTVDTNFVDGRIYVKVKDQDPMDLSSYSGGVPLLDQMMTDFGISNMAHAFTTQTTAMQKVYRIEFSDIASVDALVSDFSSLSFVEYAEKAPLFYTTFTPNDYSSFNQYSLDVVNAEGAWDIEKGGAGITVAIIDNGVLTTHEDLSANIWENTGEVPNNGFDDDFNGYTDDVNGYDVADGDNDANPPSNGQVPFVHGTHCAGIAAARTNNGVGVASIGYDLKIIPVKCTEDNTEGNTLSSAYAGVDYALTVGADIISMSFGSSSGFLTWDILVNQAQMQGTFLVAAAGNDNTTEEFFPAAYPYVFSVGATDQNDKRASFSNYGSTIDVMAPGVSIRSTFFQSNSEYGNLSGTSMACPLVAGLAGLILSYDSSISVSDLKNFLRNGCDNIDAQNPNDVGQIGAGRINAQKSMQLAAGLEIGDIDEEDFAIELFPNPAQEKLRLRANQDLPEVSNISFIDLSGRQVKMTQLGIAFSGTTFTIDITDLSPGAYFFEYSIGDFRDLRRFIKE